MVLGDDLYRLHLSLGRLRDWANAAELEYAQKAIAEDEHLSEDEKLNVASLNNIVDNCEYILQDLEQDIDVFDATMHPSELFESSTSEYLNKMRDNYQVADTCFDQVYDRALPQQEAFEAIEEDLDRLDRDYTLSRLRQSSLN